MLLLNTSTAGIFQREPRRQLGRREPPLPAPGPRLADAAARRRTAQSLGAPYAATRTHAIRAAAAIRSPPLPGLLTLAVLALTGLARRRARQAAYVTWVEPLAVYILAIFAAGPWPGSGPTARTAIFLWWARGRPAPRRSGRPAPGSFQSPTSPFPASSSANLGWCRNRRADPPVWRPRFGGSTGRRHDPAAGRPPKLCRVWGQRPAGRRSNRHPRRRRPGRVRRVGRPGHYGDRAGQDARSHL